MPHWCPPNAESPFASLRCYLAEDNIYCCLNRHYPVLIAHMGSWARPKPSFRLRLSLVRKVFAGCCQSLLRDDLSRRYLCNPYMVAWTLTPRRSPGAFTRFFPENIGLTLVLRRSTHRFIFPHCNFSGACFRGCSHSFMFRPPCSLGPQIAPTAVNYHPQGGRAVYTTQWTCGYPHELWYRCMPESGNWHGGTLTR